ncbi:MAG: hypothetical protein ABIF88_00810 [archaeon]
MEENDVADELKKENFMDGKLKVDEKVFEDLSQNLPNKEGENIEDKKSSGKEEVQLIWFFLIVVVVFASFLIPYFYIESLKSFDYEQISWTIEDLKGLKIFHGQFVSIQSNSLIFNLYLRNDPRDNNVSTVGDFKQFRYRAYISVSEDIDVGCRGKEVSRVMVDLSSFLRDGVGIKEIDVGASTEDYSNKSGMHFISCANTLDHSVIIVEKGNSSFVKQSEENPFCYTIQVSNCDDLLPVEKFFVEVVSANKEPGE